MSAFKSSPNTKDVSGKSVKLPEKYPRKQSEGPAMDYTDSSLAFPKSGKKKKGKK